jgi:3-deoxy-manno-octulosonate cytidylyltransferase (CMP-KDO synthetase)
MKILGIIPARYASTRFPGKPLADILGKSMVRRVYENASGSVALNRLIVATDDRRIMDEVSSFGGESLLTSSLLASGTDRCGAVLDFLDEDFDFVINIQGDEPLLPAKQIDGLAASLHFHTEIASQMHLIDKTEDLFSASVVKVVTARSGKALYFSREPIPHLHNAARSEWIKKNTYYRHTGMYAYRSDILKKITRLQPTSLEISESLEQLRWLQEGFKIEMAATPFRNISVDTPNDLSAVISLIESGTHE